MIDDKGYMRLISCYSIELTEWRMFNNVSSFQVSWMYFW